MSFTCRECGGSGICTVAGVYDSGSEISHSCLSISGSEMGFVSEKSLVFDSV